MKEKRKQSEQTKDLLRKRAEELLARKFGNRESGITFLPTLHSHEDSGATPLGALSETAIRELIHELQVNQIELEMQNEELRRAQSELEDSRNKYAELYDFAPVGYFTLNQRGIILEVNLTGAALLGIERTYLMKRRLSQYIAGENQDAFHLYRKRLLETAARQTCELRFRRKDGKPFYAQLEGIAVKDLSDVSTDTHKNLSHFRVAMLDITSRKQADEVLRNAHDELEMKVKERTAALIASSQNLLEEITVRKRAEGALRESLEQLSKKNRYERIISAVTRSVHQSIDLQKVLENAVEAMRQNIDCVEFVSIYLVEGEQAVLRAYRGYPDWFRERIGRIPYPRGFTWRTIIEGKSRYVADVEDDTVIGPAGREMGTKSYASIPINFQDKTVGCININSLQKDAFDEEELRLLETVAQQIETALNNAQKAEALRQSEDALRKGNEELEIKVAKRTGELSRANEALQVEIMERRRVEEQIKVALEEKEVLIKEIQHRVKNNLQVISSLVDLQTEYLKDNRAINVFNETQTRIKSMALIHEQLYQSRDLSKIDFAEYTRALGEYLLQSYGAKPNAISLEVGVENVLLDVDTAVTCGLIINELVSNSLKHAFPDGRKGEILIGLRSNSHGRDKSGGLRYTLVIRDNGIGIHKDFDLRKTESLGLQLVDGLIKQLQGNVTLSRRGGTAFRIVFGQ